MEDLEKKYTKKEYIPAITRKYKQKYPYISDIDIENLIDENNIISSEDINIIHVRMISEVIGDILERTHIRHENDEVYKNNIAELNKSMSPSTLTEKHRLLFDSKDLRGGLTTNPFKFNLGGTTGNIEEKHNIIERDFKNAVQLNITRVILPLITYMPYITLVIPEIDQQLLYSTNENCKRSFAVLTNAIEKTDFLIFDKQSAFHNNMEVFFENPITISRLTFEFRDHQGNIIDFPEDKSIIIEMTISIEKNVLENSNRYLRNS